MLAVFDLGFSSLKYKVGEKRGRIVSAYTRHGDDIVVGEEVLLRTGSNYLKTPEDLVRHYASFVAHALQEAAVSPGSDMTLAVGLPFAYMQGEMSKGENNPSSGIFQIKQSLFNIPGYRFADVLVFGQGHGGIMGYLDQPNNQWGDGNIMGIDIGFNTVISTLYSRTHKKVLYNLTEQMAQHYYR